MSGSTAAAAAASRRGATVSRLRASAATLCLTTMLIAPVALPATDTRIASWKWKCPDGSQGASEAYPNGLGRCTMYGLNANGVIIEIIEPEPTPEERRRRELEEKRRRELQEKENAEREYRDKLFRSFPTLSDLESYHRTLRKTLYFRQSENDRKLSEARLAFSQLAQRAEADYNFPYSPESRKPPVPDEITSEMVALNASIRKYENREREIRDQLDSMEDKFARDLSIYRNALDLAPLQGAVPTTDDR